jgi:hypothetical protein
VFHKIAIRILFLCILLAAGFPPHASVSASRGAHRAARLVSEVTAFDLIIAMNTLRVSNGLPALVEDPIINAVA